MTTFDEATASAVADAVDQFPAKLSGGRVVFGFDGFVDQVREVVADRRDPETHDRLDELAGFSERVAASVEADSSLSFEWIQRGTRTGGHTCHLGRAFGKWGSIPFSSGCTATLCWIPSTASSPTTSSTPLGEPGYTDAVEFDDGKLLLIENGDSMELDWDRLCDRVGRETLATRLDGARLFGAGYWAETLNLPDLLSGLRDLWPELTDPPETVVVDPGDVRKLDPGRLRAGREALGELDDVARSSSPRTAPKPTFSRTRTAREWGLIGTPRVTRKSSSTPSTPRWSSATDWKNLSSSARPERTGCQSQSSTIRN